MKAKQLFLWVLGLLIASVIQAQDIRNTSLSGTIYDDQKRPVEFAAVAVFRSADSALVTGTATSKTGHFIIPTQPGNYFVRITFLTFEDHYSESFTVGEGGTQLPPIYLKPRAELLQEFEITAEKPQMELKLDKRVFNVGKDMNNKGSNAAEVLDNIPSVTVDVEGNVSLRGSENVRILIDGKPSGLVGISSSDALRQLQGDMVETVEVITNPSARYDAEGEVGIINIILKKDKRKGVNGGLDLSVGYPHNYGASFNLNVRKEKFNLFGSYGGRFNERPGSGLMENVFTEEDTTYRYDQTRDHTRGGLSHNLSMGTDIYLGSKASLTVSGLYKFSDGNNKVDMTYTDIDANNVITQEILRTEDEKEDQTTYEVNLNWRQTFEQKDRLWTIDAKWMDSDDIESSDLYEISSQETVLPLTQRTTNTENEEQWLFQTDYIHPFGKEGKFEMGGKTALRTIDNNYSLEEQNSDASWFFIDKYTDHLVYQENIYAAYIMAGNKTGKFSYQGGLRGEWSDIRTHLIETNTINDRDYFNLFPSAHFSYELKKENFLQLSYSRRLSRPRFWWLLPFLGFSDARSVYTGNPNLNPEYTDSYELGYLKQWKKGSLLSSVYYRHTLGVMQRVMVIDEDSVSLTRSVPLNIGTEDSYGFEFSGSYEPVKGWNLNGNVNVFHAVTVGKYEDHDLGAIATAWTSKVTSKWTIKKKFGLQTSINYRSPRRTVQGERKDLFQWNGGFAVDILKGNGTLTFNAKDILNTRRRRSFTYGENFTTYSEFQWRSRQFTFNFNYRINQKKKKAGPPRDFEGGDMM